ncbi:hypothetical protein [Comamonas sp. NoAH]|uniref:hypothetical protein n=1 Tax=Comamonas halotolerans TaxID=3041496 RepID=UPI0024E049A8|nr:hypothetical protein [Comamonas sp. NoAH]
MTTELVTLPPAETALQVFSTPAGLDPYLERIKAEIDAFTPDVSTKKGRDAIASIAHKVARSKTALDDVGKKLVADLKDVPKKIDAERKRMRDILDQWKDDVRRPLTEWEQAEEARIQKHRDALARINGRPAQFEHQEAVYIAGAIAELESLPVNESWEEYESEAHRAKAAALESLNTALVKRQAYEAEQAELARLRAEAAEREQKEREERIAREAAERAKQEAEAQAKAEHEAAIKREAEAKAAAERRELELRLAAEKAEREKLEAEQRAVQAAKDAEARVAAAAEAERQRIAKEQAAAEAEAKRREADKEHRAAFNRQAMRDFIDGGLSEECAKLAVTLIAQGKVSNIAIHY